MGSGAISKVGSLSGNVYRAWTEAQVTGPWRAARPHLGRRNEKQRRTSTLVTPPSAAAATRECPAGKPACLEGQCVECAQDSQCADPLRRFCAGNVCVDCREASPASCGNLGRVCDPTDGSCVECLEAAHCKTPAKSFCAAKVCVGCQDGWPRRLQSADGALRSRQRRMRRVRRQLDLHRAPDPLLHRQPLRRLRDGDASELRDVDAGKPVCAPDGACVECNTSADCTADVNKPICVDRLCAACTTDAQCALKLPDPGVCLRHLGGRCATDAETIYVKRDPGCGPAGTAPCPCVGWRPPSPW